MSQADFFDCAPEPISVGAGGLAAPVADVAPVRTGRRAVHASTAARVKAHRASLARLDALVKPETKATIKSIAEALDASQNEVIEHLIRFALTNRNWKQVGLMGRGAA